MLGYIFGLAFILWCCVTLFLFGSATDMYDFLRSMGFIAVCVGYIVILAGYFITKELFKEEEY